MRDHDCYDDPWESVRLTKEAIRARAVLILYATLVSIPYVALTAAGACHYGLLPHEVMGVSCYNAMLSAIFFFDTLRNAAHDCFDRALAEGYVNIRKGIPVVDQTFPQHRLARLSFAIGGRFNREEL